MNIGKRNKHRIPLERTGDCLVSQGNYMEFWLGTRAWKPRLSLTSRHFSRPTAVTYDCKSAFSSSLLMLSINGF